MLVLRITWWELNISQVTWYNFKLSKYEIKGHLISKDLTSDKLFDTLSRTINQDTKQKNLISNFKIL